MSTCSMFSGHDITLSNSHQWTWHDMTWHDYPEQLASSMSVCSRFSGHDMTWHDMTTLNNLPHQCQSAAGSVDMTWRDTKWLPWTTHLLSVSLQQVQWTWHDVTRHEYPEQLTSSMSACSRSACVALGSMDMTRHDTKWPPRTTHVFNVSPQQVSLCSVGFGGRGGPEQVTSQRSGQVPDALRLRCVRVVLLGRVQAVRVICSDWPREVQATVVVPVEQAEFGSV